MLGIRQTEETLVCCRADGQPLQPRSVTQQFTLLRNRLPAGHAEHGLAVTSRKSSLGLFSVCSRSVPIPCC